MTKKQTQKFKTLCKKFKVKCVLSKQYEICHKKLLEEIHRTAKSERLHDGYYWLVDKWILNFNRRHGTTQNDSTQDLKVGIAKSNLEPVDFLYERYLEIEEYRKKKWTLAENRY